AAGFSPPPCSSTSALRVFFFTDTAPAPLSTLSLHDALPISLHGELAAAGGDEEVDQTGREQSEHPERGGVGDRDEGIGEHDDERSEEHTSELQSRFDLVCRLLLEKKNAKSSSSDHAKSLHVD